MFCDVLAYLTDIFDSSLVSIISVSQVRYEGTLHSINSKEATISLACVRSFGLEGRAKGELQAAAESYVPEMMAAGYQAGMVVLQAGDIKDMQVFKNEESVRKLTEGTVNAGLDTGQLPSQESQLTVGGMMCELNAMSLLALGKRAKALGIDSKYINAAFRTEPKSERKTGTKFGLKFRGI